MESNRQTKRRWSALDTVIVLLVLVALAGIVYRVVYTARQKGADTTATMYKVDFEVAATHADVLEEIQGAEAVYFCENDVCLGYIAISETDTGDFNAALVTAPALDEEGTPIPGFETATGSMICTDGTLSNGGGSLLVGASGLYLTPGSEVEVRTDRALLHLRVVKITPHHPQA